MSSLDMLGFNVAKLPIKSRNQWFDSLFYDVNSLSDEDKKVLNPLVDLEGTIIVVPPKNSGRSILHHPNVIDFMNENGHKIKVIAISGVGSSVLGTAALARNIADYYNTDVAGIVTGYGATDMIAEGLGGWFFYGMANRFRHRAELLDHQLMRKGLKTQHVASEKKEGRSRGHFSMIDPHLMLSGNSDVATLINILGSHPQKLECIVGHSKGCLLLGFALRHYADALKGNPKGDYSWLFNLNVVTLSTVTEIPDEYRNTYQFIGELDGFGRMNSCMSDKHIVIPNAWHHLNPAYPCHLSVAKALEQVLID